MHIFRFLISSIGLVLLSLASPSLEASGRFLSGSSIGMQENSPVNISIEFPFTAGPVSGHVPFVVTVHNMMGRAGVWSLEMDAGGGYSHNKKTTKSHFRMEVPAGKKQQFYLSAPVQYTQSSHSQVRLKARFDGPYTAPYSEHYETLSGNGRNSRSPTTVLLSPSLRDKHGRVLESLYKARGFSIGVGAYKKAILPEDWRCYVGFSFILMEQNDWLGLPTSVRDAIMAAVATGEVQLRFSMKEESLSPELADQMGIPMWPRVWAHGFGKVARYPDSLEDLLSKAVDADAKSKRGKKDRLPGIFDLREPDFLGEAPEPVVRNSNADSSQRPLGQTIYKDLHPSGLISLVVVVFGLLVGPVNLFVFAKGRRRLRLFITTPLIALGASLLLIVGILFGDGIGGEGYISRLIYLQPDSDVAYVRQEQLSKTGLFFSEPFEVEGDELMHFQGARLSSIANSSDMGSFHYGGGRHSGDWFTSKRLQSHALKTYLPSRESIELIQKSGKPHELFSNFRAICDLIYYVDNEGAVWRARDLRLGGRQTLEPVDKAEFKEWYVGQCYATGMTMGNELALFGIRKGHYYAEVSDWQQSGLNTIDRIKWGIHSQILIGKPESAKKGGVAQ